MHRLADVEFQLIMQQLNCSELLQLARCSHRCMRLADDAFSWRAMPILQLQSLPGDLLQQQQQQPQHSEDMATSLAHVPAHPLRHLRCGLVWSIQRAGAGAAAGAVVRAQNSDVDSLLTFAARVQLLELTVDDCMLSFALWLRVLSHSSLQRLVSLSLGSCTGPVLRLVCSLADLASLRLKHPLPSASDSDPLCSSASLTALHVADRYFVDSRSCMPNVIRCPHILHLSMQHPPLHGDGFRTFFASPNMQRLQTLTLTAFSVHGVGDRKTAPVGDMQAAFASLTQLHTLHLIECVDVDTLLPQLVHAPVLRCLKLQPACVLFASTPSAPVVLRLLTAAPQLHCDLLLQSNEPASATPSEHEAALQLRRMFAAAVMLAVESQFTIESNFA